ncbi:flavodoxin domain-containing protein [Patescibacteria group bacterium]
MNTLIVYATHSGSTYCVASEIMGIFGGKYPTLIKRADETDNADVDSSDVILIGSSSWDYKGKRGYPLRDMMNFLEKLKGSDLSGKKIIVFGCGDSDYEYFCGAVDVIEEKLSEIGSKPTFQSLKINRFFLDELQNRDQVKKWAKEALNSL